MCGVQIKTFWLDVRHSQQANGNKYNHTEKHWT